MEYKVHSLRIDLDIIKRIKVAAASMGVTMAFIVRQALEEFLNKIEGK
jgi:predicted DNA-binding protein